MDVSRSLIVLTLLLIPFNAASADIFALFSDDGGTTFSNTFTTAPGSTVSVGVFVEESAPNTELSSDGLIGFGFDLTHTTGNGSITSATPNPFFDVENHNVTTANGFEWEYFENAGTGLSGSRLFLGTFDFDASGSGTTTFTMGDRLVGSGFTNASWLTPGLAALDEEIFGSGAADEFQFDIIASAVPEPGAMIVFAPLMGLFLGRRRKA